MKNEFKSFDFIGILATFILVNVIHYLAGFDYKLHVEGIFTYKFLIDIASWVIVYIGVKFLLKKIRNTNDVSA